MQKRVDQLMPGEVARIAGKSREVDCIEHHGSQAIRISTTDGKQVAYPARFMVEVQG